MSDRKKEHEPVAITGIWLATVGPAVVVRAEVNGKWVEVIRERVDGAISHIVEPGGIRRAAAKAQ